MLIAQDPLNQRWHSLPHLDSITLQEFSRCTSFSFSDSLSCFTRKMTTTVWSIQCQWSDSQSRYQQHNQQQTQPVSDAFEYRLECDMDRFSELLYVYLLLLKRYCIIQPIIWGINYLPQKLLVMNIIRTWLGPEFGTKQTRSGSVYTIHRLKRKKHLCCHVTMLSH